VYEIDAAADKQQAGKEAKDHPKATRSDRRAGGGAETNSGGQD
jgi:hypothetical protein